jgi:hypothetical protein
MFYLKNDLDQDCTYDNEFGQCGDDIANPYLFMVLEQTALAKGSHVAAAGTQRHHWFALGVPGVCEAAPVHEFPYKFRDDIAINLVWSPGAATKTEKAAATACSVYTTITGVSGTATS